MPELPIDAWPPLVQLLFDHWNCSTVIVAPESVNTSPTLYVVPSAGLSKLIQAGPRPVIGAQVDG